MKKSLLLHLLLLAFAPGVHAAGVPIVQPYRALGEVTPWTIEGQLFGFIKVRATINRPVVAEGPLDGREFTSTNPRQDRSRALPDPYAAFRQAGLELLGLLR